MTGTPQLKVVGRGRAPTIVKPTPSPFEAPDLHDKDSESSEDDYDPFPKDLPPPEPDSPPREFTLDPETGLIVGQAEGEPEPVAEEPPKEESPKPAAVESPKSDESSETEKKVATPVPVSVTTPVTVTTAGPVPAPSMPDPESILPDTPIEIDTPEVPAATISLPETSDGEPLMITGEDGVIYRVSICTRFFFI